MEIVSYICVTLVAMLILLGLAACIIEAARDPYRTWKIWLWVGVGFLVAHIIFTFLTGMYRVAFDLPVFFWEWEALPKEFDVPTE